MKTKLISILVMLFILTLPTSALAKGTYRIPLDLSTPNECVVGEPCHIQAVTPFSPYNPPYTYTYLSSPGKNFTTCIGWEILEEGRKASCLDDDVGHGYTTFADPGIYKTKVWVTDGLGNKGFSSVEVEVKDGV